MMWVGEIYVAGILTGAVIVVLAIVAWTYVDDDGHCPRCHAPKGRCPHARDDDDDGPGPGSLPAPAS